jgi:hypothetical protein
MRSKIKSKSPSIPLFQRGRPVEVLRSQGDSGAADCSLLWKRRAGEDLLLAE